MKQLLLKIHVYSGLSVAIYLVIFSISSLNFNHHFTFMQPGNKVVEWSKELTVPIIPNNQQLAEALQDSLDLMGWIPWWRFNRTEDSFSFYITHSGKEYHITALYNQNQILVKENLNGFWTVFNGLHFLGSNIPHAPPVINSWQYYQDFSVLVILFLLISGIYLWTHDPKERRIGIYIVTGFTTFSFLFMFYIWLIG